MVDVILIRPPLTKEDRYLGSIIFEPLGLLMIAAVLEQHNCSVKIIDLQKDKINLPRVLSKEKPKIVGITGVTISRFESFKIARIVKSVSEEIITVYGGPHASFCADETLMSIPEIDIIVKGEGELTFLDLIRVFINGNIGLGDVQGIAYRSNNNIIHNSGRPRINDLDTLPFPARHLMQTKRYIVYAAFIKKHSLPIIASRGCAYDCSYCAEKKLFGKFYAKRSPRNTVDEIEVLIKTYGVKTYLFLDSVFGLDREHAFSICEELIRRRLNICWACQTHVSCLNLEIMKRAGCILIYIGLESIIPSILQNVNKDNKIEQVENFVKYSEKIGMLYGMFMMTGLPGEALDDALKSLNWYLSLCRKDPRCVRHLPFNPTKILPGTPLEAWAREKRYLPEDFSWSKPYYCQENKYIDVSVTQPLLVQPQFGYDEYRYIHYLCMKETADICIKKLSHIKISLPYKTLLQ